LTGTPEGIAKVEEGDELIARLLRPDTGEVISEIKQHIYREHKPF